MKKILSVVLFISGLMPLLLGLTCLLSFSTACTMLKLPGTSADVFQAVSLFGICLLPLGFVQLLAGYWVWSGKGHGIALARFVGLSLISTGALLFTVLHRSNLALPDLAKGVIITVLAFL